MVLHAALGIAIRFLFLLIVFTKTLLKLLFIGCHVTYLFLRRLDMSIHHVHLSDVD